VSRPALLIVVVAVVAAALAACGSTGPAISAPPQAPVSAGSSSDPNGDVLPSPIGTYHSGRATLALSDGSTVVLDTIAPGPHLFTVVGSHIVFTNAAGWYLTVDGAGAPPDQSDPSNPLAADVQIDRITNGHHLAASAPADACTSTVSAATPVALSGGASCHGLTWTDVLLSGGGFDPSSTASAAPGTAPFDAQITFDARP
jgi:predicted small lipoprotein YifL